MSGRSLRLATRWRVPALLLVVAISAGACDTPIAEWMSSLAGRVSPLGGLPDASGPTTAGPSSSPATGSSTDPIEQASITDPDLTLTLPVRWTTMPIDTYRDLVARMRDSLPTSMKAGVTDHLAAIDSGAVRLVATGPSGFGPWTGTLLLEVDTGDPSLDSALDRVTKLLSASGPPTFEQRHITFAFGECERVVATRPLGPDAPAGSIPARAIVYVIRLVDGRTLLVQASGPEAAQGFDSLIDASVMTLAPS